MQQFLPEHADLAACRSMMRGGSKTFFAAGLLLPKSVYEPATALYAFCRLADDAIDEVGDTEGGKAAALAGLRVRLDLAYAGTPMGHPADRAFADALARHDIPRALPESLLEGFAWDAENRRYEDIYALHAYAARVAGTVGVMMAVLMGVRAPGALARACDLGIAMQLTNIARDVGEDAREGRLYLPLSWLHAEGIDPDAFLGKPVFTPALGRVIRRVLETAETLYARGSLGIPHLPARCRPAIRAAGLIYAEIGNTLARSGYDSVSWRAHVPARRKAALLARSLCALVPRGGEAATAPALAAAHYLVDAACAAAPWPARGAQPKTITERVLWVCDLFERLQQQELGTS
jgi:phytoene synthase